MPKDQKNKTATLVCLIDEAAMTHTFNPSSHTSCHRNPVVHSFNPRTREDYEAGGDSSQSQSPEVSWRQDHHFQTEVKVRTSGWLLCFSGLQVEPQYLSLGFY